jgi:phage terminase large subunit
MLNRAEGKDRDLLRRSLQRRRWRDKPSIWVRDSIKIELAHYRSQEELTTFLETVPNDSHLWVREKLAQKALKLDPTQSYQGDVLDKMSTPGYYTLPWANGTAKTTTGALFVLWFLDNFPGGRVVTTAGTWSQLREQLWREIAFWASQAKRLIAPNTVEIGKTQIDIAPDWAAFGRAADKSETFEGVHAPYVLLLVDEAKAVPPGIFEAVRRILRGNLGGQFWWVCLSSPGSADGPFYDVTEGEYASRWNIFRMSAYESDRIGLNQLEDDRQDIGEGSPLFVSMNLGEFPDEGEDTVIPLSWIISAVDRPVDTDTGMFTCGCDVARYGGDETAIGTLDSGRFVIEETYQGKDTTFTAGKINEIHNCDDEHRLDAVAIDDTGVGGGVTDQLKTSGIRLRPVNFSAIDLVKRPDRYANNKAEMYFYLRDAFEETFKSHDNPLAGLCIPNDKRLIHQLNMQKYHFSAKQQYLLESHEALQKRGEKSPDRADALALAHLAGRIGGASPNNAMKINAAARRESMGSKVLKEQF